jgi:hypothetical protein
MEQIFAGQDAALSQKLQAVLGPEASAQYQEYTRNLASFFTMQEFKQMLDGDKPAKEEKGKLIYQLMQEESQKARVAAGLPDDFQLIPVYNFRNIASEQEAEKNLDLLEGIYEQVATRSASFLDQQELEKFARYRSNAVNANRLSLSVNRKMMAPVAK